MNPIITPEELAGLSELSTPMVSNVIERLELRLRNEGYSNSSIACRIPQAKVMAGYAVTLHMRTAQPPVVGHSFPDRSDWWEKLESVPKPCIAVIEDMDTPPGTGAVAGGIHGAVFKALGCIGLVTNGAVRDLPSLEKLGLHIYSGSICPSHAYAHVLDVGAPVSVAGLSIKPGDLLHGDMHGIVTIPPAAANQLRERAIRKLQHENAIERFCTSADFSVPELRRMIKEL